MGWQPWQNSEELEFGRSEGQLGRSLGSNPQWYDIKRIISELQSENFVLKLELTKHEKKIDKYKELLEKSDDKIKYHEKSLNDSNKQIKAHQVVLKDLIDKSKVMESDIKNTRDKTLEPLAVFVGLFTFVSVGFNIFANVKDVSLWISLLLIIAGIVVIFASLVIHAGSLATKENNRRKWTAALICVGLMIVSVGVMIHFYTINESVKNSSERSTRYDNRKRTDAGK